jgi:hypothetical protein
VFRRYAAVWHVTAAGRLVRTTGEHPFFVVGKGWTAARALAVSDRIACLDGSDAAVEEAVDTGSWEVVYNLWVSRPPHLLRRGRPLGFCVVGAQCLPDPGRTGRIHDCQPPRSGHDQAPAGCRH